MGEVDLGRKELHWALDIKFEMPIKQLFVCGCKAKDSTCGLNINLRPGCVGARPGPRAGPGWSWW
jgi:hypothetical protein